MLGTSIQQQRAGIVSSRGGTFLIEKNGVPSDLKKYVKISFSRFSHSHGRYVSPRPPSASTPLLFSKGVTVGKMKLAD